MNRLVTDSYSPATLISYRKTWKAFQVFREHLNLPYSFPIVPEHLALFLAFRAEKHPSASTARSVLTALSWFHKINNVYDPTKNFTLSRMILGLQRKRQVTWRVKPMGKFLLIKVLKIFPFVFPSAYSRTLMKSLFLLAYYGCMRIGELTFSGTLDHTLLVRNVKVIQSPAGIKIQLTLASFKHSKAPASFLLLPLENDSSCPVNALLDFLKVRPPIEGPLFIDHSGLPITRHAVALSLKKCVEHCGLPANEYNTHSLRVGRATDLALAGTPDHVIRKTGRWSSNAYLNYIRFDVFQLP